MKRYYSISEIIENACKKYGIEYKSIYKNKMINDAIKLGELIIDLKIITGELEELAEKHKIDGLKGILHKEALKIENIDHELMHLSKLLKEKK